MAGAITQEVFLQSPTIDHDVLNYNEKNIITALQDTCKTTIYVTCSNISTEFSCFVVINSYI